MPAESGPAKRQRRGTAGTFVRGLFNDTLPAAFQLTGPRPRNLRGRNPGVPSARVPFRHPLLRAILGRSFDVAAGFRVIRNLSIRLFVRRIDSGIVEYFWDCRAGNCHFGRIPLCR